MNKLVKIFMESEGISEDEARGMYLSLKDEVLRTLDVGDLDDDDTLDELECIFSNYELEMDWLDYVLHN